MDPNQLKQYTHKIKKFLITNKNKFSLYQEVIFKINIEVPDDEIIRFSLKENSEWIDHQRYNNDYYMRIPNELNTSMYIYVHFFPKVLYDYEEETQIFSKYDFKELMKDNPTNFYGESYNKTITNNQYEWNVDDQGKLKVQSLLQDSVTNYNDPNYKNYINDDKNNVNMTQKGFFPLSSKYRQTQNWIAPDVINNPNPIWQDYTSNNHPFWEARIEWKGLSPLITNGLENSTYDAFPLNVFLNYEYLPTTREYHQHYYGFEPTTTECKTINVFEGTNIKTLDDQFGSDNNYRLITWGNPYDDSHSMFVDHDKEVDIALSSFTPSFFGNQQIPTCSWTKNICEDYYVYSATEQSLPILGCCTQRVTLIQDMYYTFKYYIYIPSYANVDMDTCYVTITADDVTYKLSDVFIKQDKILRDQWIYHEIPFKAGSKNVITIIGPQTFNRSIDTDNSIFFTHMSLYQFKEYSPVLKYTNTGLYVTEQNKYIFKSGAEEVCNQKQITKSQKKWEQITEKELPTPYSNVYMTFANEENLYYDPVTSNLYFTHTDTNTLIHHIVSNATISDINQYYAIDYNKEENQRTYNLVTATNDYNYQEVIDNGASINNIKITNDVESDIKVSYDNDSIIAEYDQYIKAVKGTNNEFTIHIKNAVNDFVTSGTIKAAIFSFKDKETPWRNADKPLEQQSVRNGVIYWNNIDLSDFDVGKYYLRLEYTNPCNNKKFCDFKPFYIEEEKVTMYIKINDSPNYHFLQQIKYDITTEEQLPVKIKATIVDQLGHNKNDGYCELSINDVVTQTTLVDYNGVADFYLDINDIQKNCQTIKIEYYRTYYNSVIFKYFDLCLDPNLDLRPAIPIEIQRLENNQIINIDDICTIDTDDVFLCYISSRIHSGFSITIYKNDEIFMPTKNIYNKNTDFHFLDSKYDENYDRKEDNWKIVTSNLIDDNGREIDNQYRPYERTFKVVRKKKNTYIEDIQKIN